MEIITKNATMRLVDGIIEGYYHKDTYLELNDVKEIIRARLELSNFKTSPILVDAREIKGMSKEARKYFGSEKGYELLSAAALLSDSNISNLIVNFFIKVNLFKTAIPVRQFADRREALNWLAQFK